MSQSHQTPGETPSSGFPTSTSTPAAGTTSSRPMTTIPYDQPVALSSSGELLFNPRSCVTCRQRKVRCDKSMPCQNCRRARISCVYPAPGRAPRRPRAKDPNAPPRPNTTASQREAQLLLRLHKLEGIVDELSGQMDTDGSCAPKPTSTAASPEPAQQQGAQGASGRSERAGSAGNSVGDSPVSVASVGKHIGRLVLHDKEHTRRYVSSAFWTRLKDELDDLHGEMNSHSEDDDGADESSESLPDDYPDAPPASPPLDDHHAFLLGYRSADVDLTPLHPLPSQVPFLWQTFRENVDAMVKVFHGPTIEKLLREARRTPGATTTTPPTPPPRAADEAVLFTIYYSAVASMEDDEAEASFGSPKTRLLARYRFGVEQALARANLLNTTDMAVLQALAVFLTVVRRHDDTKFCWTMTALAVRIAQALGLHRDGTQLGLAPLEVESRRRLWWAILALDLRSAEELGSDLVVAEGAFDTLLPTNVNDADLEGAAAMSPGSPVPAARQGRTDMAVCLVRLEICALARRLHSMTGDMAAVNGGDGDAAASLAARDQMLSEVHARVENQFLRHVISSEAEGDRDPLFWVASLVARVVMAKIGLLIYQPVLFPGSGPALSEEIRDRLFASTVDIVEHNHVLNTDPRCRQWRWLFQTYRQWHAIAYMLLEVARRPWSASSERAWEAAAILAHEGHELGGAAGVDHTAVWMPMRRLYARAKRHRAAEIVRLRADPAAAKALDEEERRRWETPGPLLPVTGAEARMEEVRSRWRALVSFEAETIGRAAVPQAMPVTVPPPPAAASPAAPTAVPTTAPQPLADHFEATLMAPDFTAGNMWQYVYQGGPGAGGDMAQSMDAFPPAATSGLTGEYGTGPWPWPVPEGGPLADIDMDVGMDFEGFDWQAWQRELRGLE
ncbi:fungal-specific transcription factor domain-containing protein [Plectosphaerella plurivora]|uniref:Fungal-specific transcription factor domain-containing protein n=1 Tax=Plectosphaerella plurivora TaxID=936078 RepID=A0A9P8VLE9_9PEZI|nr:fungal-specific transcription factor domain-containing protein [Plectosphaerella plurivora]